MFFKFMCRNEKIGFEATFKRLYVPVEPKFSSKQVKKSYSNVDFGIVADLYSFFNILQTPYCTGYRTIYKAFPYCTHTHFFVL